MVCNNCGKTYDDGMAFCPDCGTPAPQQPYQQNAGAPQADPVYQMPNYQMPNQQMPNYQMPNQQIGYEKPVSIGQYIGWLFLAFCMGPISFIISIVFACMGENKSRANFFRAVLVIWAISAVVTIIVFMCFGAIFASILSEMGDNPYFYDEFLSLIMRLKF